MTRDQGQWQLVGDAPVLYERYLVPAMTAMWAADLGERADLQRDERILDVACGTGVVARMAAGRVGGAGHVAALDNNPGMLAVARSLPAVAGAAIEWHEGTALALPFADRAFDVGLCQLGLQFFPDRPRALEEIYRVLVPGGRLALNVFGTIEHNPATHALANALDRHFGPNASLAKRTEHSLADTEQLQNLVAGAGFLDVVIATATKQVRFPSIADYVRIQLTATPLTGLTSHDSTQGDRLFKAVARDVRSALDGYLRGGALTFPQEVHILTASRTGSADPRLGLASREPR